MKQAQNAQKRRGRPTSRNNGKSNHNNRNDSKPRGNPKQLCEKYKNQAREALQAGDRMQAEYYFQFADHYHRVANEMRGPSNQTANSHNNNSDQNTAGDGENNAQQPRRRHNNRRNHRNRDGSDEQNQNQNATPQNSEQQSVAPQNGTDNAEASKVDVSTDVPTQEVENVKPAPRRRKTAVAKPNGDVSNQEQPAEVHPELNLDAPAEKPVRRRAPVRRKKAEVTEAASTADAKPSSDGEAA
ncbi:DUF4167 domain-containing protein [Kordiimonas aquimaris]|uniref:DUF4167 domain-containing protein n=1 Tax=Kordiimonas aquimaris TaxID=707591 RepID=UPI0021D0976F|nr:DUF4167 domain-containing protein [Kordiimonas aquimaris]